MWVDETRPRLQGAKLTAWELMRGGVPMHLIADNAAGHLMQRGKVRGAGGAARCCAVLHDAAPRARERTPRHATPHGSPPCPARRACLRSLPPPPAQVNVVLFGADRVAANGDVANKIGTYKLCVVAKETGVATYACVPTSTIDLAMADGMGIEIEERAAEEVTMVGDTRIAPEGVPVFNPAFDVTTAKYITGIITEEGVCYPPFTESLARAKTAAEERRAASWKAKLAAIQAQVQPQQ